MTDKMRTEVGFEVTIEHFVTESDPSPTEQDIWRALDSHFSRGEDAFDIGTITVRSMF